MANPKLRVPENLPGDFFVDSTCIDCDTCRQIARRIFGEAAQFAFVRQQPHSIVERRSACCVPIRVGLAGSWSASASACRPDAGTVEAIGEDRTLRMPQFWRHSA